MMSLNQNPNFIFFVLDFLFLRAFISPSFQLSGLRGFVRSEPTEDENEWKVWGIKGLR